MPQELVLVGRYDSLEGMSNEQELEVRVQSIADFVRIQFTQQSRIVLMQVVIVGEVLDVLESRNVYLSRQHQHHSLPIGIRHLPIRNGTNIERCSLRTALGRQVTLRVPCNVYAQPSHDEVWAN